MLPPIPSSWPPMLIRETRQAYFQALETFVAEEQAKGAVFPAADEIFAALELTPFERVRVVLLGQDPYPTPGHAHGLCFSVRPGIRPPPSLANIFKEMSDDLGIPPQTHCGTLTSWARQGVLLLNTVLTVRAGEPNSHKGRGWETFTDRIIRAINDRPDPAVFVLWGKPAQKKQALIDPARHPIITAPHPSPLSARSGFFGSKTFTKVNGALCAIGGPAIDWRVQGGN